MAERPERSEEIEVTDGEVDSAKSRVVLDFAKGFGLGLMAMVGVAAEVPRLAWRMLAKRQVRKRSPYRRALEVQTAPYVSALPEDAPWVSWALDPYRRKGERTVLEAGEAFDRTRAALSHGTRWVSGGEFSDRYWERTIPLRVSRVERVIPESLKIDTPDGTKAYLLIDQQVLNKGRGADSIGKLGFSYGDKILVVPADKVLSLRGSSVWSRFKARFGSYLPDKDFLLLGDPSNFEGGRLEKEGRSYAFAPDGDVDVKHVRSTWGDIVLLDNELLPAVQGVLDRNSNGERIFVAEERNGFVTYEEDRRLNHLQRSAAVEAQMRWYAVAADRLGLEALVGSASALWCVPMGADAVSDGFSSLVGLVQASRVGLPDKKRILAVQFKDWGMGKIGNLALLFTPYISEVTGFLVDGAVQSNEEVADMFGDYTAQQMMALREKDIPERAIQRQVENQGYWARRAQSVPNIRNLILSLVPDFMQKPFKEFKDRIFNGKNKGKK